MEPIKSQLTPQQSQLVAQHIGYASQLARRLKGCGLSYEDLIQEACYGLCLAALAYDPGKGVAFTTLAYPYCRNAMFKAVKNYGNPMRLPSSERFNARMVSLQSDDEGRLNADICEEDNNETQSSTHEELMDSLDRLSPRERTVMLCLYGLGRARMSTGDTVTELVVGTDCVSRIHTRALRKLGTEISQYH